MRGRREAIYAPEHCAGFMPGCEDAKFVATFGMTLGIRDARKIEASTIHGHDVREQARFDDAIGIFPDFIDGYGVLILPTTGRYWHLLSSPGSQASATSGCRKVPAATNFPCSERNMIVLRGQRDRRRVAAAVSSTHRASRSINMGTRTSGMARQGRALPGESKPRSASMRWWVPGAGRICVVQVSYYEDERDSGDRRPFCIGNAASHVAAGQLRRHQPSKRRSRADELLLHRRALARPCGVSGQPPLACWSLPWQAIGEPSNFHGGRAASYSASAKAQFSSRSLAGLAPMVPAQRHPHSRRPLYLSLSRVGSCGRTPRRPGPIHFMNRLATALCSVRYHA